MRKNVRSALKPERTHEGGAAPGLSAEQRLQRTLMSCLLGEKTFYEEGDSIEQRIADLVPLVKAERVATLARDARSKMKLRHAPLLVVREMARHASHRPLVAATLAEVIQRPDELAEFLAMYWKDGRKPLAAQVKKGLAVAFQKFNAYSLAKYNRADAIKLRDVLFLVHAKPKDAEQAETWKKLVSGTLESPDTWEVALSGGEDKKAAWTRLLAEKKLGALALLRNLRNMIAADVESEAIASALRELRPERVLPYRFIAALRYAPQFCGPIEEAMFKGIAEFEKIPGTTALLIDVSGSMDSALSSRSEMMRLEAAGALAIMARELCSACRVFTFSQQVVEVPAYRGLALSAAISDSQPHGGTYLGRAVAALNAEVKYDRLIVITDEQSHDSIPGPNGKGYVINVASYKSGVGYGAWTHIDGFSERVLEFVTANEAAR